VLRREVRERMPPYFGCYGIDFHSSAKPARQTSPPVCTIIGTAPYVGVLVTSRALFPEWGRPRCITRTVDCSRVLLITS